ncbi:2'-O-glycosyltransferase CruG [Cylindrospermopsis raciborskii]|uniref:Glycosyltransferase n=1 Tax=Cylindrospermopsis raciborskii CS-506_A TaxID=2585140 RepID=A0A838WMW7_9CYAN|nr:glycosyltransferase family 2 protein [Cylindrospermopsis raciborskii]MBA4447043.1 glycosyltransferase [Cylindrospermopsis raciborskii CS-506_C]MBA4451304.1 glycosyltransferase [Cylindrospermopsis raciborskii CS-506_D]MBA4457900.1 glycosyltransferase [Cylindrospermopsis raciborskii CS-506_B]MBA4467284.1 glycosyltransferase [Cylindrospermopsis raciborskii CS-506_A]OHY37204.1 glycosyl transferase [Cylindrospermopsis raciborskii CS-508]
MIRETSISLELPLILLVFQVPAVLILISRLLKGPTRHPPIEPQQPTPDMLGSVSVIVPTLNEALRITPLLSGLTRQSYEVREIIVVDSRSKDGTPDLVKAVQQKDPRFRVMTDDPLPTGWVGRPWALHNGFLFSCEESKWFLGMDADIQPHPGLVASLVRTAEAEGYDLVSLSPQFILKYPGECWLQPSLLLTLLYRFDPAGTRTSQPERVMANGQCFLCRRSVLATMNGYTSARSSFCDDVTLARNIAAAGFKVGFLDGARVFQVRMYEGAMETWKEWGRSLDLKDASPPGQVWGDLWLLFCVQGLPLPVILAFLLVSPSPYLPGSLLLALNVFLLIIRFALLLAISPSYDRTNAYGGWLFWLSPFSDPLAVIRIFLSALRTPKEWRGRKY